MVGISRTRADFAPGLVDVKRESFWRWRALSDVRVDYRLLVLTNIRPGRSRFKPAPKQYEAVGRLTLALMKSSTPSACILLIERNLSVDHVTIWRWVQRYAPPLPPGTANDKPVVAIRPLWRSFSPVSRMKVAIPAKLPLRKHLTYSCLAQRRESGWRLSRPRLPDVPPRPCRTPAARLQGTPAASSIFRLPVSRHDHLNAGEWLGSGDRSAASSDPDLAWELGVVFEESLLVCQFLLGRLNLPGDVGDTRHERVDSRRCSFPDVSEQLPGVFAAGGRVQRRRLPRAIIHSDLDQFKRRSVIQCDTQHFVPAAVAA